MIATVALSALAFNAPALPRTTRARHLVMSDATWTTSPTGLKYLDETVGTGEDEAKKGSIVTFDFKGRVVDGQELNSAKGVVFEIGAVDVIKGWEEGLQGMKVGGVRKVEVPPALWIDAKGSPVTKGLADSDVLEFDFELKFCKNPSLAERALDKIDMKMTTQNKILGGLIVLIGVYELIIAFAN